MLRMNGKRILIFSYAYTPLIGGAEVAVDEITRRIPPEQFFFDMITRRFRADAPKEEKIGNVTVYRIAAAKYLFPLLSYLKAQALYRAHRYDAVWAVMANYAGFGALFFKLSHPRVPFLLTLQEGDPIAYIKRRVGVLYPLFVRIFTKADIVQTISHYLGNFAREMGFKGPLLVIPNGANIKHFSEKHSSVELDALKKKLGKRKDDIFIITTSRLVKKNAADDVIRALALLPEQYIFLILGTGPDEAMLRALVKEREVENRVLFLGQIGHRDMPKYLAISDIFTRPSLSEGMGNSFVEAMAAGGPVVATQEGGIADFLFDPKRNPGKKPTGLAVNPRDPEGLARQIRRLTEDKPLRVELIKNARELAIAHYDWDLVAKDMREKFFGHVK